MKKIITLLSVFTFLSVVNLKGQACIADTIRYRDSTAGVFPLPYDIALNPRGGIDRIACVARPYRFVFTVKVAATITFNGIQLPLDSVVLARSGALTGMPTGLTYACNPPNCSFRQQSYGCVLIHGTPTGAVQDYALTIAGTAHVAGVGPLNLTFPGLIFPGEYKIKLVGTNDAACPPNTASQDLSEQIPFFNVIPNPTDGKATFKIEAETAGDFVAKVVDGLGRVVEKRNISIQNGINLFDFDASALPNGVYLFQISQGDQQLTRRFVVQH